MSVKKTFGSLSVLRNFEEIEITGWVEGQQRLNQLARCEWVIRRRSLIAWKLVRVRNLQGGVLELSRRCINVVVGDELDNFSEIKYSVLLLTHPILGIIPPHISIIGGSYKTRHTSLNFYFSVASEIVRSTRFWPLCPSFSGTLRCLAP